MARRVRINRARIQRIIQREVETVQRDIRFTQGLTTLVEGNTTLQAGTSLTLTELSIAAPADPFADPDIQLLIEETATLSISG